MRQTTSTLEPGKVGMSRFSWWDQWPGHDEAMPQVFVILGQPFIKVKKHGQAEDMLASRASRVVRAVRLVPHHHAKRTPRNSTACPLHNPGNDKTSCVDMAKKPVVRAWTGLMESCAWFWDVLFVETAVVEHGISPG